MVLFLLGVCVWLFGSLAAVLGRGVGSPNLGTPTDPGTRFSRNDSTDDGEERRTVSEDTVSQSWGVGVFAQCLREVGAGEMWNGGENREGHFVRIVFAMDRQTEATSVAAFVRTGKERRDVFLVGPQNTIFSMGPPKRNLLGGTPKRNLLGGIRRHKFYLAETLNVGFHLVRPN